MDVPLHEVQDPAQWHWADAMHRMGGGGVANHYLAEFFLWWRRQIVAIDDYPYVGIDFRGDSDMLLPPGSTYGDIGNESRPSLFKKFELFNFLCFVIIWNQKTYFCVTIHSDIYHLCANVGPL